MASGWQYTVREETNGCYSVFHRTYFFGKAGGNVFHVGARDWNQESTNNTNNEKQSCTATCSLLCLIQNDLDIYLGTYTHP